MQLRKAQRDPTDNCDPRPRDGPAAGEEREDKNKARSFKIRMMSTAVRQYLATVPCNGHVANLSRIGYFTSTRYSGYFGYYRRYCTET